MARAGAEDGILSVADYPVEGAEFGAACVSYDRSVYGIKYSYMCTYGKPHMVRVILVYKENGTSTIPLIPPVAVCLISICVTGGSLSGLPSGGAWYCSISSVTVAKPIALRVSQPTPWRVSMASRSSDRVLFCFWGDC